VILKNGKIINLGKINFLNNNYTIIDGTDKYLIPGLVILIHLKESKTIYFYI
jgi:imidazolonepropionase-like amidohydrolase